MNCSQARALLAIFRELQQNDRQALEQHLAHCDACKEADARALFVGERVRSATRIEPPADAYDKLMHTLAAEHVRYLQKTPVSSTTTPIPAFLTPYLPELARKAPYAHSLAALSTADTGALPAIRPGARVRRRGPQMRHFAIVGIAASFLVMIMSTGLLSLLYLANQNQQSTPISRGNAQVIGQAIGQASLAQFKLTPDYPNIASASINNGIIYYSAYNHDGSSWTLDKFAQQDALRAATTKNSLVVTTIDARQIVVLGTSNNWLFWLQMEPNTKTTTKTGQSNATNRGTTSPTPATQSNVHKLTGNWSLQSLYIGNNTSNSTGNTSNSASSNSGYSSAQATPSAKTPSNTTTRTGTTPTTKNAGIQTSAPTVQPQTLHSDTFNASAAPAWVTSPIQGISFFQDSAVVAYIDSKGTSYLTQYSFDASNPAKPAQSTRLASAAAGHVLTSPTTNDNGTSTYWSEEWYTQQDGLQGEIWHRQLIAAQPDNASGRFSPHLQAQTYRYSTNTNSFRPQIVNNTLFLLSKDPSAKILQSGQDKLTTQGSTQGSPQGSTQGSPQGSATATAPANNTAATPSPTPTPQQDTIQPQLPGDQLSIDPTIRTPQIDENITGKLQAFVLNSIMPANTIIEDNKIVVGIHGGTNYLIWKDPDGRYEMYDARNNVMVNGINDIDRNATFMSVSGNSVLWTQPDTSTQTQPTDGTNTQVTFNVLNWPR